ncbi:hypothetical protein Slala04_01710 [Streptomyces lavendulae subsp. lavendulae]|nr:hypothetical protein Slala04_01710 [Streptomyces lavendulae subsp. lavendulae]
MSTTSNGPAEAGLGTRTVAEAVDTDPSVWAFTAMQDAPGHVQAVVLAVMNTAHELDAVQRHLRDDAVRAIEELSKTAAGTDSLRATDGLLGDRGARIERLAVRRGELLRRLDAHLTLYQAANSGPEPSSGPTRTAGPAHPADSPPQARGPRR